MRPKHQIELRTLPAMLSRNAEEDPERTFLLDEAGTLTRAQAYETALAMSAAFARLGVEHGDTVAIMLDNRREFLESWFGLGTLGAVEVPVNPLNIEDRLVHVLNHSQSRLLVVQAEYLDQVETVADRLTSLERVVVIGDATPTAFAGVPWSELERDPVHAPAARPHFSDPVAVMYTSGSTGPAKGALLSHSCHYTNGHQPVSLFEITADDRLYICLPLHHNMAQGYGVWPAIVSGGSVRLVDRFHADSFWGDLRATRSTIFPFVGAMLTLLAKRPPLADDVDNPLRIGFGVPIPADLHESFEDRFGLTLVHAYGSTEATIVAWNHRPDRVLGAAGPVLPGYKIRIVDEDDLPVPPGALGEICIRPEEPYSMFSGYFRDPERTATAFRNLWYHSGDRGRCDDAGNLWFSDRKGDVIRRMGEFVSSYEVEQVVIAHPDVKLTAAFGVPSELSEEEVMVAVVLREGTSIDADELRAFCAKRLPRFAVPRFVDFVQELPMTPTGKVEKYKLCERGVTYTTDDGYARKEIAP